MPVVLSPLQLNLLALHHFWGSHFVCCSTLRYQLSMDGYSGSIQSLLSSLCGPFVDCIQRPVGVLSAVVASVASSLQALGVMAVVQMTSETQLDLPFFLACQMTFRNLLTSALLSSVSSYESFTDRYSGDYSSEP